MVPQSRNKQLRSTFLVALFMVAILYPGPSSGCADPTAMEQAVRTRVRQFLDMYPSIYNDILQGRLVPTNQRGNAPFQQGGLLPNQQGGLLPNQQGGLLPNQQGGFQQPFQQGGFNQQPFVQPGFVPGQQQQPIINPQQPVG